MTANKNIEKYLCISAVMFITYLFLGSFIVSKDFFDLGYLIDKILLFTYFLQKRKILSFFLNSYK